MLEGQPEIEIEARRVRVKWLDDFQVAWSFSSVSVTVKDSDPTGSRRAQFSFQLQSIPRLNPRIGPLLFPPFSTPICPLSLLSPRLSHPIPATHGPHLPRRVLRISPIRPDRD